MVRRRALAALGAPLVALSLLSAVTPTPAAAAPASPDPAAWIIVDAGSGKVLAAKDPHAALPPASTAKVMTALTAIERLPADALVPVSDLAATQPASKITMLPGEEWPIEQALASLLMVSANDAAYAIAEATSGSLEGFADALASTAERYGMKDSTLSDPAGFDDAESFRGGPRMSAFDIAIATRNALAVPQLAYLSALPTLDFTDPSGTARHLVNHNKLLPEGAAAYAGATGFKTGYTEQAGHTLVATASREGRTIIAVVLNTYDSYGWAWQLLDQGFATPAGDPGTGEKLPAVQVSTYAERRADQLAFVRLTKGGVVTAATGSTTTPETATSTGSTSGGVPGVAVAIGAATSTTTASAGTSTNPTQVSASESDTATSRSKRRSTKGSTLSLRNLAVFFLLLLVALFLLRRRAVKRQRARRLARGRETTEMMRRGGLPVVDGRYRTGTRTGPPVQSNLRVVRTDPKPPGSPRAPAAPRGGS